jgi:hypothetical protein
MRGLTIGQIFVLFEGMTRYVTMTSPFGGSSDDGKKTRARGKSADEPGAANTLAGLGNGGAFGGIQRVNVEDLPADIRDLVQP